MIDGKVVVSDGSKSDNGNTFTDKENIDKNINSTNININSPYKNTPHKNTSCNTLDNITPYNIVDRKKSADFYENDLVLLGMKVKKDPETYKVEFMKKVDYLKSLLDLPNPPVKELRPYATFVTKHVWRVIKDTRESEVLLNVVERSLDILDRKSSYKILNESILLRQKNVITSAQIFDLFIRYEYNSHSISQYLDFTVFGVLEKYFKSGSDKQKRYCYYYLLKLFNKLEVKDGKEGDVEDKVNEEKVEDRKENEEKVENRKENKVNEAI